MDKFNMDDIQNYLEVNFRSEDLDDYTMAIDSQFTLLAAKMFKDAGCIGEWDESVRGIHEYILKRLKKYSHKAYKKDLDECFKNAVYYVNKDTNEHYFVRNDYVDYFVTPEPEWIPGHIYHFDLEANIKELEKIKD